MLYYFAQSRTGPWSTPEEGNEPLDRLQAYPEWAGLAHSARGDVYYWHANTAPTLISASFTAQRNLRLALLEYESALALQSDDPAIHNGMALAHLKLGEADEAIREAELALESAPEAPRLQKTLIDAYAAKGDYVEAARLAREFLSAEHPLPLSLVPYSAISHGADRYSDLRIEDAVGAGPGGALVDADVIRPFELRRFGAPGANSSMPGGINRQREHLRNYDLLRYDLLSGDSETLNEDFGRAPDPVRQSPSTLLLLGIAQLLSESENTGTLAPETQAAIDAYFAPLPRFDTQNQRGPPEPEPQGNDSFYREAANFFRQHEQYDEALRVYGLWRAELEHDQADDARRGFVESLMGEAHFLNNEPKEALAAFDRAGKLVPHWPPYILRQAFIREQLGEYKRAEEFYRSALNHMQQPTVKWEGKDRHREAVYGSDTYYQAGKHLGDVLLRQAAEAEAGQAQDKYTEAVEAYRNTLEQLRGGKLTIHVQSEAADNNLAIALVELGDYEGAIETLKTLTHSSEKSRPQVNPPTPDEHNPVFRLNLGWAYELNGEPERAANEYLSAVKSDPTFFPALNDLGVLAANRGDLDEAKGYFKAALDAKADYAYANHNLGMALLRSGPWDFVAAQGYLARSTRQDPSLIETGEEYVFDNELYFLNLSLGRDVPPDWQFASEAQRSAQTVSLFALVLLVGRFILNFIYSQSSGGAPGVFFSNVERFVSDTRLRRFLVWLRDSFPRFLCLGIPASRRSWVTPLALLLAAPTIVAVQYWSLLWEDSETKLVMLGAFLCLTLVSLLVHNAGHVLAALRSGLRASEAPWPIGTALALALVAIGGPAFAPLPATSVASETKERERSFAYLAGPLASTLLAALLYALFWVSGMPLLRFGAILNLALAAVSLMALPPLEGASVGKKYFARWLLLLGTFVTAFTLLIE